MPKRHRQPHAVLVAPHSKPQVPESIEDYGDPLPELESCDSDEFRTSEMGNDGNVSSSSANSLNDDTKSSLSGMGGGGENSGSDGTSDSDGKDASLINVDFGVFEMKACDVSAVMHLMDQLCPDKMNEVDRDKLGEALHANPFTCVVKVGSDDDEDEEEGKNTEDEEDEIYGMASILDVMHDSCLASLLQLLKTGIWRTIAPGICPTDMLTSLDDATGRAKCVLLVGEYIRNVPLELTSHILSDLLERFESIAGKGVTKKTAKVVQATFPCMFALLSKIQRAVDPSASTVTSTEKEQPQRPKKKRRQSIKQQQCDEFDMSRYIFWREEDAILYEYRDKRIATVAYRCRSQYDDQPESDIPLSILYILPYGGLLQAVSEIKRRETTHANILRY